MARESPEAQRYEPSVMEALARRTVTAFDGFVDAQAVLALALPHQRRTTYEKIRRLDSEPVLADTAGVLAAAGRARSAGFGGGVRWRLADIGTTTTAAPGTSLATMRQRRRPPPRRQRKRSSAAP